ncbi:hypothetical protein I5U05_013650 [Stenotrophomonas maltophilia]|uniref:hypothetical protein n=1 Tax=Stenotrophomonas maltophilia TaxID=40324 RepID=UPI00130FA4DB|nr:hypothetical protein [Stenotrophomonas maltophilia]MBC8771026.1 hypothetical protein [Stenotrophomonas maltophilia]MBH1608958.1 hypothetical protein [Stenotrophomonas maltophilia]MBH1725899.1 hypothetical protein [Stenotrophomonas maltophilia]MBH1798879.1 hypothetical protein [Stenotrophomonas maltophilia]MBH1805853.1 hypothetical protein [Stenotrophomonas maltophilia]
MRNQLDIFDHDPTRLAAANRAAADHALQDVQFTNAERESRAAYHLREVKRWEIFAAQSMRIEDCRESKA